MCRAQGCTGAVSGGTAGTEASQGGAGSGRDLRIGAGTNTGADSARAGFSVVGFDLYFRRDLTGPVSAAAGLAASVGASPGSESQSWRPRSSSFTATSSELVASERFE